MAFAKARALGVDFLIHYGMRPQKLKGGRATSSNEQWPTVWGLYLTNYGYSWAIYSIVVDVLYKGY
jgi:hypothetical protein